MKASNSAVLVIQRISFPLVTGPLKKKTQSGPEWYKSPFCSLKGLTTTLRTSPFVDQLCSNPAAEAGSACNCFFLKYNVSYRGVSAGWCRKALGKGQ